MTWFHCVSIQILELVHLDSPSKKLTWALTIWNSLGGDQYMFKLAWLRYISFSFVNSCEHYCPMSYFSLLAYSTPSAYCLPMTRAISSLAYAYMWKSSRPGNVLHQSILELGIVFVLKRVPFSLCLCRFIIFGLWIVSKYRNLRACGTSLQNYQAG